MLASSRSVVRHLILRKALRTLPALEHGTELRVCHAQHIHCEEITMYPSVEDVWTIFVCEQERRRFPDLQGSHFA